jgi:mono/diheme cytochrome c family protein
MVNNKKFLFAFTLLALLLVACGTSGGVDPQATPLSAEEAQGKYTFQQHCAACHSNIGDVTIVGPSLAGIATRAETRIPGMDARAYIEESILAPDAFINEGFDDLMPKTFGRILSGEELDALIAYLLTLK